MGKNRNQWVYTLLGYVVIAFCVGLVGALIVGGGILGSGRSKGVRRFSQFLDELFSFHTDDYCHGHQTVQILVA